MTAVYRAGIKIAPLPDFTANYHKTIEEPREAAEKAEAARQSLIAQEAENQRVAALNNANSYNGNAVNVQNAIIKWANYYGVASSWLLRVANCESGFTNATNYGYYAGGGNPHGIFQFLPQTFYGNGGRDYESYDDQARVAAYMFSIGQSGQWACK